VPFAVDLRTNVRTLENWEPVCVNPNAQPALLINLVRRYRDTVERLTTIQSRIIPRNFKIILLRKLKKSGAEGGSSPLSRTYCVTCTYNMLRTSCLNEVTNF